MSEPAADALRVPATPGALFLAFNRLALQGFGGVLPVAQRELVERERWMTREQFLETLSVGQVLPGPNIVNMALMIGDRFFGWRGVAAALGGLLAAPLLIVLLAAALYGQFASIPMVAGALRGMGAVAAGLIIATALKLMPTLRANPMGRTACVLLGAGTLLAIGVLRWPLAAVVLGLGVPAVAFAWWKLRP
ncbi:chromate transporter [Rubrivivax sp. RP6-9]|uniref:chromate transporter n=1 Tax=Rubrivivax sp. RP6-9 TaxID=3415750 RepID=UPI003CC55E7B